MSAGPWLDTADPGVSGASWTALRYMARFRCLGSACEDDCCSEPWHVPLDAADLTRLEAAMGGSEQERERLRRGCVPPSRPGTGAVAELANDSRGACLFFGADRLCTIQSAHGVDALAGFCATYPRAISLVGEHWEVAGRLSCPEVARLCLLHEDAFEWEPYDPKGQGRLLAKSAAAPLLAEARATVRRLLRDHTYPLSTRLCGVTRFLSLVAEALAGDVTPVDARLFAAEVRRALALGFLDDLDRARAQAVRAGQVTFVLVQEILLAARRLPLSPGFTHLLERIYAPYEARYGRQLPGDILWADFAARRRLWEERFAGRIGQYFDHFAINHWTQLPAGFGPGDLLAYQRKLMVSVALLRYLLLQHPDLDPAAGLDRERLDRAVVEACYTLSRALDHNREFDEEIQGLLRRNGLDRPEQAVFLVGL